MTSDLVYCSEEELTNDPLRFDGARIEVVGEWSSFHFEDSDFAQLGLAEPHDFRFRHRLRRCFGRLWVRLRAHVEIKDLTTHGRRRGLLYAESIEVLEEIRRDGTRAPPPVPRDTGWFFTEQRGLFAIDHLPANTGNGIVRESSGDGGLELVDSSGAVAALVSGPALDGRVYFTRDRHDANAWAHLAGRQKYGRLHGTWSLEDCRRSEKLALPDEGATFSCSRKRGLVRTSRDDPSASLHFFPVGDRHAYVAIRGNIAETWTLYTGAIAAADQSFTIDDVELRLSCKIERRWR